MTTMASNSLLATLIFLLSQPSVIHSFQSASTAECSSTINHQCSSVSRISLRREASPGSRRRQNSHPLISKAKRKCRQQPPCPDTASSTRLSMCQLMGMNCAAPTEFTFSFRGFALRGGATDVHSHGWGLCFYDGRGLRAFHDPDPAADSLLAEFLQTHPVKTHNMVSHIR